MGLLQVLPDPRACLLRLPESHYYRLLAGLLRLLRYPCSAGYGSPGCLEFNLPCREPSLRHHTLFRFHRHHQSPLKHPSLWTEPCLGPRRLLGSSRYLRMPMTSYLSFLERLVSSSRGWRFTAATLTFTALYPAKLAALDLSLASQRLTLGYSCQLHYLPHY